MQIEEKNKTAFFAEMMKRTDPIQSHEAAIISSILETEDGQYLWRSRAHSFCEGCRKRLTPLDYFLSSLRHHGRDFLIRGLNLAKSPAHLDMTSAGTSLEEVNFKIVSHKISVQCSHCGEDNISGERGGKCIYFYKHPFRDPNNPRIRAEIRMSEHVFKEISDSIKVDLARVRTASSEG